MKFLPEMSEEQEMPDAGQDVMLNITTPAPVIPQLWNDGPCSPAFFAVTGDQIDF